MSLVFVGLHANYAIIILCYVSFSFVVILIILSQLLLSPLFRCGWSCKTDFFLKLLLLNVYFLIVLNLSTFLLIIIIVMSLLRFLCCYCFCYSCLFSTPRICCGIFLLFFLFRFPIIFYFIILFISFITFVVDAFVVVTAVSSWSF